MVIIIKELVGKNKFMNMKVIAINKKALISFLIFIIIISKYILINKFEIIPQYGILNRALSWFIIMPLILIGTFFSFRVLRENYLQKINKNKRFFDYNLLMSIPTLLCFFYIIGMVVYVFYQ